MVFGEEHAGRGMVERMIGAARLDPEIYEEVEADRSATRQAAAVVVIVAAAGGLWVPLVLVASAGSFSE